MERNVWPVKSCVIYIPPPPLPPSLFNPVSQFPHGHVSGRALDTTHIPTSSYVCLLIITAPHQRGPMHNTLVCKPNGKKPQQGDQRDQNDRSPPPLHPPPVPFPTALPASHSTSWVINYRCLRSSGSETYPRTPQPRLEEYCLHCESIC